MSIMKMMIMSDMGMFSCNINPESIKYSRKIQYHVDDKGHVAGKITKHMTYDPETVSFEILLDGTGGHPDVSENVAIKILMIVQTCYNINGGSHEAPYCRIAYALLPPKKWRCTSLDVNYTLFDTMGFPLRAKVSLSFPEHLSPQDLDKMSKLNSPDLTHMRTIREGDTIFNLCHEIYGKIDYAMAVAEHNKLSNYRELEIGSIIEFPPLDK